MKYLFLFLCILSFHVNYSQDQDEIISLVDEGIVYHDEGDYDKAIKTYKKALKIDRNSPLVNYEIALSYFYKKDYKNAIKYSDVVIDNDGPYVKESYITKGSSLDNLGKTKQSIKLFKKAIKKYKDENLLYYNLALNYYKLDDLDNAETYLIQGIEQKSDHSSSHLMLGYINFDKNKRVQSLLNLHYFLFLEPTSNRSPQAASMIQTMMAHNVTKDKEKPNTININLMLPNDDDKDKDEDFGAAELMISLLEASKSLEKNEGKSDDELFIENTDSFFGMLGELRDDKKEGIYWNLYIPFYDNLSQSDHMPAYCHYVMQSASESSQEWLDNNTESFEAFAQWLRGY
ncbi:tetratricopeptide repeat protein [uncultured Psychroserpens sp.]|uniref:tetratricopeptide repeat protein n=1 Tax=uncultured Psychroserpens sp. TaxID=255436 RepID=UPI0026117322|nr:tetratricopeptide repeat protein [uncultured Psychroserpens sp.]